MGISTLYKLRVNISSTDIVESYNKLYRIDCSTYRAFCIYCIVWTALFDKRLSPWRSVAEASLVNHERFPGRDVFKKRAFKWSNLIRKVRVAELGSPAGLKKKTHAVIGHQNFNLLQS